jgi:hypothetical protein
MLYHQSSPPCRRPTQERQDAQPTGQHHLMTTNRKRASATEPEASKLKHKHFNSGERSRGVFWAALNQDWSLSPDPFLVAKNVLCVLPRR